MFKLDTLIKWAVVYGVVLDIVVCSRDHVELVSSKGINTLYKYRFVEYGYLGISYLMYVISFHLSIQHVKDFCR